ncbi:MAG: hypothetical protein VKP62_06025 [Candidatus Sericytochromatia bacterium]|nr:hypothetical protein [Candidatus Sericytochromatia bacterium]
MSTTAATLLTVGLYVLATAPFLPLMLYVHRLDGAYAGLFMGALVLQLVPLGMLFLPLGALGVALLMVTLYRAHARLVAFRDAGLHNPRVHARWIREYLANLVALGLALEQKAVAWIFLEASSGKGLDHLYTIVLPASLLLWAGLLVLIRRENQRLKVVDRQVT